MSYESVLELNILNRSLNPTTDPQDIFLNGIL